MKTSDVNMAMLQQAAEELEIGVPIRAWEVRDGELVLHLAYGNVAVWSGATEGRLAVSKEASKLHAEVAGAENQVPGTENQVPGTENQGAGTERSWKFVEGNRKEDPPEIPTGSLRQKTRQQLLNVALDWGFQSTSAYVRKDEIVEALEWLRKNRN